MNGSKEHALRLFASTGCVPGVEPVLERITRYRRAGVSNIELGAHVSASVDDLAGLQDFRGNLLIHNYFPPPSESFVLNLASRNLSVRSRSLELAKAAMQWCERLAIPYYSVHGGFITDPGEQSGGTFVFPAPRSDRDREEALSNFAASLEELLDLGGRVGVELLVENNVCYPHHVGKLLLQTPEEFVDLFHQVQSDRLGILLDTGHLNVSATTLKFDRSSFPGLLADRIRAVHLHDNDGFSDQHVPPSEDSWVFEAIEMLHPKMSDLIIEAKFETATTLGNYAAWLRGRVAHVRATT